MATKIHFYDIHGKKSTANKDVSRLKKRGAKPVVKKVWDEWAVGLKIKPKRKAR